MVSPTVPNPNTTNEMLRAATASIRDASNGLSTTQATTNMLASAIGKSEPDAGVTIFAQLVKVTEAALASSSASIASAKQSIGLISPDVPVRASLLNQFGLADTQMSAIADTMRGAFALKSGTSPEDLRRDMITKSSIIREGFGTMTKVSESLEGFTRSALKSLPPAPKFDPVPVGEPMPGPDPVPVSEPAPGPDPVSGDEPAPGPEPVSGEEPAPGADPEPVGEPMPSPDA